MIAPVWQSNMHVYIFMICIIFYLFWRCNFSQYLVSQVLPGQTREVQWCLMNLNNVTSNLFLNIFFLLNDDDHSEQDEKSINSTSDIYDPLDAFPIESYSKQVLQYWVLWQQIASSHCFKIYYLNYMYVCYEGQLYQVSFLHFGYGSKRYSKLLDPLLPLKYNGSRHPIIFLKAMTHIWNEGS